MTKRIVEEPLERITQSFFELVLCPNKLFKESKKKVSNLLSYDRMIENVVEFSELKDFIINDKNLKYIGNCKLNYEGNI